MHAALLELADNGHQVFDTAPQPVEFPHDQAVIFPQHLQRAFQAVPGRMGAAGLIGIDCVALRLLQGGALQAEVLVLGGDSGITDVHG